ncbi:hypothetical protein LT679_10505 [Mucilaginibacter roseus]|uniref:Fibronectin type III domain-containing protein n=1 Tax=Mucilaginibacter roseus TaxID=1528868 RepID=A0ABS8U4Q7_9SPHI|nr:hypothetical protein [Mucilaginibacter roseus]MCD8741033.1 hypothetical protein [Mucilaginibacter roseus]
MSRNSHLYATVLALLLTILSFSSCKKQSGSTKTDPEPVKVPEKTATLTTSQVIDITTTNAVGGGKLSSKGSSNVTEQGVCWATKPNPTINDKKAGVYKVSGSGDFTSQISGLTASTKYYVRAFAVNKAGIAYGDQVEFTSADIADATFNFEPLYMVGSTVAAADVEVTTDGGNAISERGICWGTSTKPTVNGSKVKDRGTGTGKFRATLSGLSEKTNYYARAYAINAKGVSYSAEVTFKTIAKGNVTYTFNKSANPTAEELEAYGRLQIAIDSATWYLNNYTSATKHVYLNLVDGTPTADANNQGWMRFGTNPGFQNIRTMLHELNHTLGTGTSNWWWSHKENGKLQAPSVTAILRLIDKDNTVMLNCDDMHWWPYGLNQNSEVSSSWDYVYNAIIIEAMRKDGLTEFSGPYQP